MAIGCTRCLRVGLVLSSAIFLILGDVIVGAGIYFALYDGQLAIQQLRQTLPREFLAVQMALIALGSTIVLLSFTACAGVLLRSRCALVLYTSVTGLLALCCAALAISLMLAPALKNAALSEVENSLRRSYGNTSLVTFAVDYVQSRLSCCGWQLPKDAVGSGKCGWFAGTAWHKPACPPSCCPGAPNICSADAAHEKSCFDALKKYLIAAPAVLLLGMALSLLHMLCALMLALRLPKDRVPSI